MNVLGISCFYHDSAACLMKDGRVVAAAEEERFSRKKHDNGFPKLAIDYCLSEGGITVDDLDYVGFYEKPFIKFERLLYSYIDTFPKSLGYFLASMPSWLTEKLFIPGIIRKKTGYKGKVVFVEHHMSHAASAFLVSPFKEAAILTIDGVGEWTTASYGVGKGTNIELFKEIRFPDSLGLLYSAITSYCGFMVNNDEYKIMGLAPYGRPIYLDRLKEKVITVMDDGSFTLNMEYFAYHYRMQMLSKKFEDEFGPARKKGTEITQHYKDMAASMQKLTEEIILKMASHLHEVTGMENLCMAGGCALNSVANGFVLRESPFKDIFIQPAASDAGGALGVAAYIYNSLMCKPKEHVMDHAYLGPGYSAEEVKDFLDANKIPYEELSDGELYKRTAKLIADNYIIGWYQDRLEYGPRALGNRSILANACNPEMKDILNMRVKHREEFRPFAPAITLEDVSDYFDMDRNVPYMLIVCDVKKDKRKVIPAITHVDGTGRVQTVTKEANPKFHTLIKEFEKITGVPVVVNTSFNVRGMPIVCTPKDAYDCFAGTGIDYLVMDHFLVDKKNVCHQQ